MVVWIDVVDNKLALFESNNVPEQILVLTILVAVILVLTIFGMVPDVAVRAPDTCNVLDGAVVLIPMRPSARTNSTEFEPCPALIRV